MSDTKGVLPSGQYPKPDPQHSSAEAADRQQGSLPTMAVKAELPTSGSPSAPAATGAGRPAEPPRPADAPAREGSTAEARQASEFGPRTRQQRLAEATLGGGLPGLPPEFGDSDGDWQTILAADPFEVLFLDFRRADRITPAMVEQHRKLIGAFWQDKIKTMSQGAGRLAIAKKYGGPQADENRIRKYPDLVVQAYHRLSTTGGIEHEYQEIVTRQERAALDKIEAKLRDFLVDHALHPQETMALFELADREGVSRAIVALLIEKKIREMGLIENGPVSGATTEQELLSTTWVDPSQVAPPPIPVSPSSRNGWFPAALLVLALVGFGIWQQSRRVEAPAISTTGPVAPPAPAPAPSPKAPDPKPAPVRTTSKPQPEPPSISAAELQAVRAEIQGITDLVTQDPQAAQARAKRLKTRLEAEPAGYSAERRRLSELDIRIAGILAEAEHQSELEAFRTETERKVAESRLQSLEDQLGRAEKFFGQGNFEAAQALAQELLAATELPEGLGHRARQLVTDAASAGERARMAVWEAKIKEIEALCQKGIYSEAIAKADQLASAAGVPPTVADRARHLSTEAVVALQKIMKKATVKSKTVRATSDRHGGG